MNDLQITAQKVLDNFAKHQEEIEASKKNISYDNCFECNQLIIRKGNILYHKSNRLSCVFVENYPEDEGKFFEVKMPYGTEYAWYIRIGNNERDK